MTNDDSISPNSESVLAAVAPAPSDLPISTDAILSMLDELIAKREREINEIKRRKHKAEADRKAFVKKMYEERDWIEKTFANHQRKDLIVRHYLGNTHRWSSDN